MQHTQTIEKPSGFILSESEIQVSAFSEKPYDQFVPQLLASYAAVGGLNNRDAHNMPSTRAIGQIC